MELGFLTKLVVSKVFLLNFMLTCSCLSEVASCRIVHYIMRCADVHIQIVSPNRDVTIEVLGPIVTDPVTGTNKSYF